MTFASVGVRDKFHRLPAQLQHIYVQSEEHYAKRGFFLHVEEVNGDALEVVIRVSQKFIAQASGAENFGLD